MPCTKEAVEIFQSSRVLFAPGKAANAGGVAVSAMEMSQNSMRLRWTFEEVDKHLQAVMTNIFDKISHCAAEYNVPGNFVAGANIASFKSLVEAMIAQGVI